MPKTLNECLEEVENQILEKKEDLEREEREELGVVESLSEHFLKYDGKPLPIQMLYEEIRWWIEKEKERPLSFDLRDSLIFDLMVKRDLLYRKYVVDGTLLYYVQITNKKPLKLDEFSGLRENALRGQFSVEQLNPLKESEIKHKMRKLAQDLYNNEDFINLYALVLDLKNEIKELRSENARLREARNWEGILFDEQKI